MKLKNQFSKFVLDFNLRLKDKTTSYSLVNLLIIMSQFVYILLRFSYVNETIPFWHTRLWGDYQLAPKIYLYLIPVTALVLFLLGLLIIALNRFYLRYLTEVIWLSVISANIFLSSSLYRTIRISSMPFQPLINPLYLDLVVPFMISFVIIYMILPIFIDYAFKNKLVTNPLVHKHPGMILKNPSARGGGFIYALVVLLVSIIYVGFSSRMNGIYLSLFMIALLGIMDDFQNTHPSSDYRIIENPFLRLILLFIAILPVISSNVLIGFISNPVVGGVLDLANYKIEVLGQIIPVVSALVTSLWIVWVMNVLSWSNGIDGQYAGIVGIASILIAILALRFTPLENDYKNVALVASISAGAAFGFTKYTWSPSKIMWGFGAMSAGLLISSLSISIQSKIVTSVLIILVPFLDALVTFSRRILQGKNPLKGDRGHFHHILLSRGWDERKIARFYWVTTALFGILGLLSPERYMLQVSLIIGGFVAFFLVFINLSFYRNNGHTNTIDNVNSNTSDLNSSNLT